MMQNANHIAYWKNIVRGCIAKGSKPCADTILNAIAFMCWSAYQKGEFLPAWEAHAEFHGRDYQRPGK